MAAPEIIIGHDEDDALPIFVRHMTFRSVGDQEPEHTHQFPHWTLLSQGRALFKRKGQLEEHSAPALIKIEADDPHQITALEPMTQVSCIHDLRKLKVV